MSVRLGTLVVAAAVLVTASSAAAHRVAVLPAEPSGGTSKEILRSVNEALTGLAESASGVDTVVGPEIKKKVRVEARACSEDPACLAKLGRRLKVDELVTVRARTHGNGLRLTFIVVGVEDRRLRRTVSVNVETVDGIAAAVRIRLAKILGVTQAELHAEESAPDEDLLALAPMPTLAPLPGADEMNKPDPKPEPVETVAAEPASVAAIDPGPVDSGPTTPPVTGEGSSWMWYSGLGMLGAGAILGGVSTFFGVRYVSKKNAIDVDGSGTTPQVRAEELRDEANGARTIGLITGVAAGVVAAAGVGLAVADLVSGDDVSVSVGVHEDGAQASVVLFW